ncbi:hypothetical protein GO755_07720 [Spirosoma sp. HMF4905]|uniref:Uncharacterized protein n=1 Tax=Spirosoma arboris TaxID=2682092 RepID=A0A7K1S8J3_9BACT|nr:hypothetical protein [Spirosoma arboris]MVM29916.1 hypothetical protein [Spirosoma arboris]
MIKLLLSLPILISGALFLGFWLLLAIIALTFIMSPFLSLLDKYSNSFKTPSKYCDYGSN